MAKKEEIHVTLGADHAAIRRSGRVVVAQILGVDRDQGGEVETVYLDRLVHKIWEDEFVGWRVWGAISTILHRAG